MQEVVQAIVWSLLNSIWQSALLWLGYLSFYRNSTTVSKKQFLLTSLIVQIAASAILFFHQISGYPRVYSINAHNAYNWEAPVFILYLCLLSFRLIQAFGSLNKFTKWNRGLVKAPASLQLFTQQHAALLGINRRVSLWISEQNLVPHARGIIRPIIILPVSLLLNLPLKETEAIIVHELAHIRHKDLWSNYLVIFVELVYYFNPFTLILIREFRLQREIRCDESVIDFGYPVSAYCQALYLTAVNYLEKPAHALGIAGTESDLLKRIRVIAAAPKPRNKTSILFMLPLFLFLLSTGISERNITTSSATLAGIPQLRIKAKQLLPERSALEIAEPVHTKNPAIQKKKTTVSSQKVKQDAKEQKLRPVEASDQVKVDANFVNFSAGEIAKEIMVVEEGSDGQTIKMIFLLQNINGTPQLIPLVQLIQTLPDSSRNVKDSIAEF